LLLGNGGQGHEDEQLFSPCGVAFVPGHDLLVVTVYQSNQIRVYNMNTGALCTKMGKEEEESQEEGEFGCPWGVAVTTDGAHVVVVEAGNERLHVLRLKVARVDTSYECTLEFVRFFGSLKAPKGVAIKQSGQGETVLVTSTEGVSEFALDGTFVTCFGSAELRNPVDLCVLPSGEVAVSDNDSHCVFIFNTNGSLARRFGSRGMGDGQCISANALACDGQGGLLLLDWGSGRLQVFDAEGQHLLTRTDLGIQSNTMKGMAWRADGSLAVANGLANVALLWRSPS
jgi:DNA-binding beta-propeller fold protein YncE